MSTLPNGLDYYHQGGTRRYIDWVEDYLDVRLSAAQREIIRSVVEHKRTLVVGANGFGKSYASACLALAFLFTNKPSTVLATSGTYGKLRRTLCKPVRNLHRHAKQTHTVFPGQYKQSPPRIDIEGHPEWFFEAARPRDAGELEGTHNDYLLAIVEEADKDAVTPDVLDSMESLLTDDRDRIIAIANPPHDETNIVADLMDDPAWHTLQYSSFESHNVKVEQGMVEGDMMDGLTTLSKIKDDWTSWNAEEWPGLADARTAYQRRDDLDERWYRRRSGVIPPDTATAYRPFTLSHVQRAWAQTAPHDGQHDASMQAMGLDVARMGGDYNVLTAAYPDRIEVVDRWQGVSHEENFDRVEGFLTAHRNVPVAIDAQGEGSGLADRIVTFHATARRYKSAEVAVNSGKFRDKWAESFYHTGQWLQGDDQSRINDNRLRKELLAAARTVEFTEQHYASRSATVLEATSKDDIAEHLGRSPDMLDSMLMARWEAAIQDGTGAQRLTW